MKYYDLDGIEVKISEFGFGAASISGEGGGYGFGAITEDKAISLLKEAKDRGVTLYDTAPIYGFCESEKRIGKAFRNCRDKVVIVSKSGVSWHSSKRVNRTNDPKITQKMLEQSLRDLQTDYIDLYLIHWPDERVDIRKPMEVLAKAKEQKKILKIGLSNTHPEDFMKAQEIEKIEVLQGQVNFFDQENGKLMQDLRKKHNCLYLSWGTLDKGVLSGRVNPKRTFDNFDARSWAPWWKKENRSLRYKVMEEITPILKKHSLSGLDLAINFNRQQEYVTNPLCGVRNPQQLETALQSFEKEIDPIVMQEFEQIRDGLLNA